MEKKKEKNIRFNLARIIFVIIILLLLLLFVKSCGSEAIDTVSRYTKAYKDSLTLELDEKTYYVLHNTNFSLPTAKAYDKAKKPVNIEITIYKNKEKVEEVTTNKIGDKFTVYYKAYKGSMYEKKSIKVEIVRNPTLLDFSVKGISNEWTNKDVEIEIVPNEENIKEYCYNTNCNGVSKKIIKKNETFDAQIKDENGNESKTKTYEVKNIDKEIPKVESVKVIKKDDKKYLVINAVDNLSGINEYSFDDGKTWIKESTLDITKVTATKTYRLKVKDNATNVSVTFSYKYIYEEEETSNPIIDEDKTSPTLTVTTTCENGFKNENWCSGNVSITINAIDESGIKEYSYDNGNTWSNNSSVIYKKEGNKNLKIKVKDNYDNISETKTTEFNIDKTSPVIEGMPEACTTSVTPNINETNIDKIVFTRNGENSVITSTITEAGLYYINVTDKAGNKAETTFKVETKCIDKTIKILNVINNNYYNVNVEPEVHGTPTIAVLKKDGIYYPFEFGDTLSEEGTYNLYVENKYGNNDEVTFTIDKQKPYVVNELRNTYESDINYQASDKNLNAVVLFKNGVPERCYIDSDSEYQTANVNCETGIIDAVDLKVLYKTYSKTQEDVIRIVAIDKAGNQEEIIIDDKISSVYIPIYSIEDFEAIGSNVNRIINGTSYYMSSNGKYRLMNNLDYNNTKYNTIKASGNVSGAISSKVTAIDTKKILQKISVDIPYSVVKFLNSESKKTEINFYKYDNQSYGNNYTAYVINAGDNQYKINNNDVYKYIGNGNDYSNPFSSTSTWGKQNDLVGVELNKILGYSGKTASKNNMLLKNLVIQNATIRSGYVFADNIDTQKKDNGIITGSYKNNCGGYDDGDYDFELNYNPETYEVTKFDTILNLKEKIVFEFDENDNEYFTFKNNQYLLNSETVEVDKSIGVIKITNSEEGTVTEIKYDTSNNDIIEYTSKYEYNMIEQGVELYAKYDSNTEILKLFEGLEITNIDNINNVIQAKKKYDSAIITINYNENNIITSITVDSNEISLDGKSDEEKTIKIVTYNSNNYVLVYLDELIMMTSNDFIEEGMNATYNSVNNSLELINEEMNGIYYFDNNGVAYKTEANGDKYSAYVKYYENNGENCFSLGEEGICESNSKYQYYSFDKEKGIIAYTNNNTVDKYEYDTNTMYIISAKEYKSELSNRFNNYTIGWGVNAQTINFRNPDEILVVSPSENENYILFNFYIENNEPIQIEKTVTFEKGIDYEEARQKNDGSYEIYERKMDEKIYVIDEYFYKYNNSFYNIDYYREHTYKYLGDDDSFEDLVSNFQTDYPTEYSESDVTDVRVDYYPYRIQDQIIDIYLNDQYKYSTFGNGISNSYGYIHIGKTKTIYETSIIYVDNKIYRLDNGTVYLYNESNKTWESTTDELDTDNDNVYVSENFYKYDDTNHVYKKFNFSSRTWNSTLDTVTAEDIGTYAVKYSAVVNDVESVSLSIELDGNNKTIMNLNNSSNNTNNNENSESLFESLDHSYIHDLNISNYNYYGLINNNESLTTGLIVKSIKNSTVENVKISNSNVYHKSNGEYHSLIAGIGGYSENVLYTNNEMDITTISNESYVFDVENYYTTTLTPFAGICFNGYNTSFINNKIIINNSGSEVYGITKEVLYSKELKNNISEINVNNNTISINVVDDQLSEKVCKNKEINQDSSGLSASNNLNNSNVIFGVAYRLSGLDNSNSVPIKMNNNTISLDINGGNTSLLVAGVYLANELTEANNNGISYNVDYITQDCLITLYEAFIWKCYPWDKYEDHTYNESACTNVYDYRTNAFHDTMSNTSADELKSFYEQRIVNYYVGLEMFSYDYNMGVNTITDPENFPTVFGESSTGDLAGLFGLFGRNIISKDLDVNNNTISLNQKSFSYGLGRAYPLIGDVITNTNNSINISENKIENFKSEFDYLDFGDDLLNNHYENIVMMTQGYSGLVSGIFDNDSNPATVNIYDNVVSGQGILKSTLISRNFASESKIYSNTINTEISQGISPLSASLDGEVIGAITEVNYGEIYNNNITITRKASKLLENSLDSGLLLDLQNGTYYRTYYSSRFINVNEITNKDELNKFISNKYSNGLAFASMNYGNIHDNTIKGNVSLVGINENTGIIGNNTINHSDDIVAYSLPLIVSANKGIVEDLVYNFNSIKSTKEIAEEEGLLVAFNMGTINNITLNVANGITSTDDIDNYLISNNYETGIISNFTFNGTITSNSNKNSGIIHTNTGTLTNIVP